MTDSEGEPLFCGKDVCDALHHTNSRRAIAKLVDEGDVTKCYTPTTSGEQLMTFINESGLYSLIMGSKLESARRFRHWVTADLQPAMSGVAAGDYLSLSLFLWRVWSRRVFFSMVCCHASVRSTPV